MYRAIATNHDGWSDSENRIKELKSDFGGDTLPCGDFNVNDLYFNLAALAYNLYALLRDALSGTLLRRHGMVDRYRPE